MPLLIKPWRVVYRVQLPPWKRARPPLVPTHKTPLASIHKHETLSLGNPPSCLRNEVNWLSRNRRQFSPPLSVPIHKFPSASSAMARTTSDDNPSRVVNALHSRSSRRTRPPGVPSQSFP